MNRGQYTKVVREAILLLRYRVELYQTEDSQWVLAAKGTHGNAGDFEDVVGDIGRAPVFAVYLHSNLDNNHVTLVSWDFANFRVLVCEFNDTGLFSQVEQNIIGLGPTEYLTVNPKQSGSEREKKLAAVFQKLDVNRIQSVDVVDWEEVKSVVRSDEHEFLDSLGEESRQCLMALASYLKVNDDEEYQKKFSVLNLGALGFMRIDASAVQALELFKLNYSCGVENDNSSSSCTLFTVLNRCKTIPGQKLLREWLARPLCDLHLLEERQDIVEVLVNSTETRLALNTNFLPRAPDCAQIMRRLLSGKAALQDVYRLYQLAGLLDKLEGLFIDLKDANPEINAIKEVLLEPVQYAVVFLKGFTDLVNNTLDGPHFEKTKELRIRPDIDPNLEKIAKELEQFETTAGKIRAKMSSKLGVEGLKLDLTTDHGYVLRCTLKDEKNIRKSDSITILETTKGSGVKFTCHQLEELNQTFRERNLSYQAAQEKLTEQVVGVTRTFAHYLPTLGQQLATIDALVSLAVVAATASKSYVRPKLHKMGSGIFKLKKCRHAIIESATDVPFIPNDVEFDDNQRLIILTGANMGGKSTYLRSAALCTLLAQIGSFVPCESAELSLVDGIFTRVGASDQQSRGISTFMAEMLDCSSILQRATANSLVVVDELGRGTSTLDGFGLASAIATDILTRIRAFCIFATHFHEMSELAEQEGAVAKQMSVQLQDGQIVMMYQVLDGVATSSFGIHVARAVQLDPKVVQSAELALSQLEEQEQESLIKRLKECQPSELRKKILASF